MAKPCAKGAETIASILSTLEGVQNSVSASSSQADVAVQPVGEVDRQLRQREVPVLDRMGPAFGRFEYTGIQQLQ